MAVASPQPVSKIAGKIMEGVKSELDLSYLQMQPVVHREEVYLSSKVVAASVGWLDWID